MPQSPTPESKSLTHRLQLEGGFALVRHHPKMHEMASDESYFADLWRYIPEIAMRDLFNSNTNRSNCNQVESEHTNVVFSKLDA